MLQLHMADLPITEMFIVNELRRDQVKMRMDRVDVDRVLEECARPPAGRPLIRDQSGLDLRENVARLDEIAEIKR